MNYTHRKSRWKFREDLARLSCTFFKLTSSSSSPVVVPIVSVQTSSSEDPIGGVSKIHTSPSVVPVIPTVIDTTLEAVQVVPITKKAPVVQTIRTNTTTTTTTNQTTNTKRSHNKNDSVQQYCLKDFATAWKQLEFSRIYEFRSAPTSIEDFTQELFAEALRFIKPTATVPTLIAGFFILYALHSSQPGSERIRVSLSAAVAIRIALSKLLRAKNTYKGVDEALALWQRLYKNNRIEFAAYVLIHPPPLLLLLSLSLSLFPTPTSPTNIGTLEPCTN